MRSVASPGERDRKVLSDRAAKLRAVPAASRDEVESVHALRFLLDEESYAVENGFVREVAPLPLVTPLPCVPPFVRGIINLRGTIVPLFDLRSILGLPEARPGRRASVMLLQSPENEFGLLVDEILGIAEIPASSFQGPPPAIDGAGAEYLKGITVGGLALIDAGKLLADKRLVVDETVGSRG